MPDSIARTLLAVLLLAAAPAGADLADPMRPSYALPADTQGAAPVSALAVSAVFISGERRVAVVNGQRVRVGETVGGAVVSRIERDRVSFRRGERSFDVPLLSARPRQ